MNQYVNLLRFVAASIKAVCTKGEIKYVTNRIITDLRNTAAFEQNVVAFEVSPHPVQLPGDSAKQQHGTVTLNKGVAIYYGIAFS